MLLAWLVAGAVSKTATAPLESVRMQIMTGNKARGALHCPTNSSHSTRPATEWHHWLPAGRRVADRDADLGERRRARLLQRQ
jgi:hypothetical protein